MGRLKGEIIGRCGKCYVLAHALGMTAATLCRKLKAPGEPGRLAWTADEIRAAAAYMGLSGADIIRLWFSDF